MCIISRECVPSSSPELTSWIEALAECSSVMQILTEGDPTSLQDHFRKEMLWWGGNATHQGPMAHRAPPGGQWHTAGQCWGTNGLVSPTFRGNLKKLPLTIEAPTLWNENTKLFWKKVIQNCHFIIYQVHFEFSVSLEEKDCECYPFMWCLSSIFPSPFVPTFTSIYVLENDVVNR